DRRCFREIGTDRGPRVAAIRRAEQAVPADVQHARIVRRQCDWRVPVPAKRRIVRLGVDDVLGGGANCLRFARDAIAPNEVAVLRFGVHDAPVAQIRYGLEPVAALERLPVVTLDAAIEARRTGTAPDEIVLRSEE